MGTRAVGGGGPRPGLRATARVAAVATPRPWKPGSTAHPVSYTGSPSPVRTQKPMLPATASSGSSTIRNIRPAPVSSALRSTYRR